MGDVSMNEGQHKGHERSVPQRLSFSDAAVHFANGAESPRTFLERCLDNIAAWEHDIGAFVHLDTEAARRAADRSTERWRSGSPLSPIDGMPLGIKDIIETVDFPTGQGSPLFTGTHTHRDAASVAALRSAGAIVLGKTVTTEFAATEPRGTRNPWDLTRTPGGSSSGSAAAVATGMLSAALGTQGIASIVRPSSFCGCIGFKPSLGGINRGGSYDTISQSCTGVLGASLSDTWQVAIEIATRAGGDPGFPGLAGPQQMPLPAKPKAIAIVETAGWSGATDEARAQFAKSIDSIEHRGVRIIRHHNHSAVRALEETIINARPLANTINAWEMRWPLNTYRDRDAAKVSLVMLERLGQAEAMTIDQYRAAIAERENVRRLYSQLREECDACLALAASGAAPVGLHSTGDPSFAIPFTLVGAPVISLPALHDEGLPLGLQVGGFRDQDEQTFAFAAWISANLV